MGLILFITAAAHLFYTPFTKVEESFNLQAMHDILYLKHNFTEYDHHTFPGVVPRTFVGPLFISIISSPLVILIQSLELQKFWAQYVVRLALTAVIATTWENLRTVVRKRFGMMVSVWYTLITISQFHFMFYMSRPLPNIMALPIVLYAISSWMNNKSKMFLWSSGIAIIVFRSELAIFLGLLLIYDISTKKITPKEVLKIIVPAGIAILVATIVVDSFFWQRLLWPEGQVLWYNTILNQSSNWGTSPFMWYFYSAIPRAMGASLVFIPFGLYLEPRLRAIGIASLAFVFLYSFLPHKELRFIIYIFPILNMAVACACHRLWINREKSIWQGLLAAVAGGHIVLNVLLTLFLLVVSSTNYPGGVAITRLHRLESGFSNVSLHISNLAAQSGVSRFTQVRNDWVYSKDENLKFRDDEMKQYTHLLVEAKNKFTEDWDILQENFEAMDFVDCFSNIGIQYNSVLPIRVKTKPCIGIMKRRLTSESTKVNDETFVMKKKPKQRLLTEVDNKLVDDYSSEKVTEEDQVAALISEDVKMDEITVAPELSSEYMSPETSTEIDDEDGVTITSLDSSEIAASSTKEINFEELRNLALGKLAKTTRTKLREIIEQHYRSKGSIIENDVDHRKLKSTTTKVDNQKRNAKATVKTIIKQEKIKQMIDEIAKMDLTKLCDLEKLTTKECLKNVIDDIDDNNK